jgi:O-antigen/teichoic acid export membrane protein
MSQPADSRPAGGTHERAIAKGAGVNVLGIVGRALLPAFFVLVSRLYGADVMGLYYLVTTFIEVASALSVSGIFDGVMLFASRAWSDQDDAREERLYRSLATGFTATIAISLLCIGFAYVGGPELLLQSYPQPEVVPAVQILALSLPFIGIPYVVVAATKSLLIMTWDAVLFGFLRPLLLVVLAVAFWPLGLGFEGLLWGWVIAHVVLTVVSLFVFARYFDLRRLGRALRHIRLFGPMMAFALPQNVNMTFNTLIGNLDVMMLGFFHFPPEVLGFYGMGTQIARLVRQVKLAFSGAYAPVITRYHYAGDRAGLNRSFATVARWTTIIAMPIAVVVAFLREDLLRVFHPSFVNMDASFMLLLLVPPILSCNYGLTGNIIVMTGYSVWNLINSVTVAGLNLLLLWLLVPAGGILGAATASLLAAVIVTGMQMVEADRLVGSRLAFREIYKPLLATVPAVGLMLLFEWTALGAWLPVRIAGAVAAAGLYFAALFALRLHPEDREMLRFRSARRPPAAPPVPPAA